MNVIVNADDFGLSDEINKSIIFCYKKGCLTSTTLFAFAKSFNNAVKLAKSNPGLGIGVHLALEYPFDVPYFLSTVMNPLSGSFYYKKEILNKLKKHKIKRLDLVKAYSMQIEKVLENKINISHIDHHHHFHLHFPVLNAIIEVAKKYHIRYIRSQKILIHTNQSFIKKTYRSIHQLCLKQRLNTVDGYFDIGTGSLEKALIRLDKLLKLKLNAVEIVAHPVEINDFDTQFLTNQNVKKVLCQHNLINYNTL